MPLGTFAYKVMLQGDTNAPSTAMQVMKYVLDELSGKRIWAYLEYIIIFSDGFENHIQDIRHVCQRLQANKICVLLSKCNIFADILPLLGHVIVNQGIHVHPKKI